MNLINIIDKPYEVNAAYTGPQESPALDISGCSTIAIQVSILAPTLDPVFFSGANVDIVENTITIPNHGLLPHQVVMFLDGGGGLPAGVNDSDIYYVIVVDENTIQVGSSYDGLGIAMISAGGNDNGVQGNPLSDGTIVAQKSLNGAFWFDIGSLQVLDTAGPDVPLVLYFSVSEPDFKLYRLKYAMTAGKVVSNSIALGKGLV